MMGVESWLIGWCLGLGGWGEIHGRQDGLMFGDYEAACSSSGAVVCPPRYTVRPQFGTKSSVTEPILATVSQFPFRSSPSLRRGCHHAKSWLSMPQEMTQVGQTEKDSGLYLYIL